MKASIHAVAVLLIATVTLTLCATASATSTVTVYIMDPANSANGAYGQTSGGEWVGQIPIKITSGSTTTKTLSYCMNPEKSINIGSSYSATLSPAADSKEWKAVSYVLSWNNPTNNNEASAAQIAIWRLLNQTRGTSYTRPSWLTSSLDNAGNTLATTAYGRDVVRQGDTLAWISPITSNMSAIQANPNQTLTFIARLTDSSGTGRGNVKILFNATLNTAAQSKALNSTYLSATTVYTDTQGYAQVTVTVPADAKLDASIAVQASTKSVWPQRYIDISTCSAQDLIGVSDSLQLTVSTNVCIYGFITVLPESPIGPLAAAGAFGAGFVIWAKTKKPKTNHN